MHWRNGRENNLFWSWETKTKSEMGEVSKDGGITEEGVNVIQESFPQVSDAIFDKTLEKRRQTTLNAQKAFK